MSIIHSTAPPLIPFPDNLTVPQFFLDGRVSHPTEPIVAKDIPCMIDESNGRRIYLSEVSVDSFDDKLILVNCDA